MQPADSSRPTLLGDILTIAAAWTLSLGFDLLLHAGLLARLYVDAGPFLLPPEEAFRRIPLGYAAFLLLTVALFWLFRRLHVRGTGAGLRYGLSVGAIVWGPLVLGLYSISTAEVSLLVGWWVGQTIELGLAGSVFGAAADGVPTKRIWAVVAGAVLICVIGTVVLQSLGFAPAMRVVQ